MALHYKIHVVLFISLIILGNLTLCMRPLQSAKIVNKTGADAQYSHTVPDSSIAYIHIASTECPRAFISSWNPGTHGNTAGSRELDVRKPLPTWVRIGFDRKVTQTFIDDYFFILKTMHSVFNHIQPVRHGKFRDEFVIQVGPHYTISEVEMFVEKSNLSMCKKMEKNIADSVKKYIPE